jgi:hypothetical protein
MANYSSEFAQDAAYQSHTSRVTELWSLPIPVQGLNTYNKNNFNCTELLGMLWKRPTLAYLQHLLE